MEARSSAHSHLQSTKRTHLLWTCFGYLAGEVDGRKILAKGSPTIDGRQDANASLQQGAWERNTTRKRVAPRMYWVDDS